MRRCARRAALAAVAALAALGLPGAPLQAAEPALRIASAEFGIFDARPGAAPQWHPTRVVPHAVDQGYGWRLQLAGARLPAQVKVREELTLPAAPATWGDPEPGLRRRVSADGRTVITEITLPVQAGRIAQAWAVAPGDPKGAYLLKVTVEDLPVQTFHFELR